MSGLIDEIKAALDARDSKNNDEFWTSRTEITVNAHIWLRFLVERVEDMEGDLNLYRDCAKRNLDERNQVQAENDRYREALRTLRDMINGECGLRPQAALNVIGKALHGEGGDESIKYPGGICSQNTMQDM